MLREMKVLASKNKKRMIQGYSSRELITGTMLTTQTQQANLKIKDTSILITSRGDSEGTPIRNSISTSSIPTLPTTITTRRWCRGTTTSKTGKTAFLFRKAHLLIIKCTANSTSSFTMGKPRRGGYLSKMCLIITNRINLGEGSCTTRWLTSTTTSEKPTASKKRQPAISAMRMTWMRELSLLRVQRKEEAVLCRKKTTRCTLKKRDSTMNGN